jgi:hypothetical protein
VVVHFSVTGIELVFFIAFAHANKGWPGDRIDREQLLNKPENSFSLEALIRRLNLKR